MEANTYKHPNTSRLSGGQDPFKRSFAECVYDYQAWVNGHWKVMASFDSEELAIGQAQKDLMEDHQHRVRVLKIWPNQRDTIQPRVIFNRESEDPNSLYESGLGCPPFSPPICHDPHDLYEPSARLTLNRLFRDYCERNQLLVGQILHSSLHMNRLLKQSRLIGQAINRTAKLQAKSGELLKRRRQTIMKMVQSLPEIVEALPHRIRQSEADDTLDNLIRTLSDSSELPATELANQKRMLGAAVYAAGLNRESVHKQFCWAMELLEQNRHPLLNQQLDLFLADLCYATELPHDMIGLAGNLGEVLIRLLRLAEGIDMNEGNKPPTKDKETNIAIARLQNALKYRILPVTRQHLVDCVSDALEYSGALEARDQNLDDQLYRMIVETAGRCYRLLAEPDFILALTRRFCRHSDISANDTMGAIRHVGAILQQPGLALIYWTTLYKLYDDQEIRRYLISNIRQTLEQSIDMMVLLPGNMGHHARVARMSLAYHCIARMAIAPEWRRGTLQLIDEALLLYLEEQDFLKEKPGDPDSFRDQAFRMVDFVQSGLLPDGQALQRLRVRISRMIKREGFDKIFVRGIKDRTMAEAAMRAFQNRLRDAGFK